MNAFNWSNKFASDTRSSCCCCSAGVNCASSVELIEFETVTCPITASANSNNETIVITVGFIWNLSFAARDIIIFFFLLFVVGDTQSNLLHKLYSSWSSNGIFLLIFLFSQHSILRTFIYSRMITTILFRHMLAPHQWLWRPAPHTIRNRCCYSDCFHRTVWQLFEFLNFVQSGFSKFNDWLGIDLVVFCSVDFGRGIFVYVHRTPSHINTGSEWSHLHGRTDTQPTTVWDIRIYAQPQTPVIELSADIDARRWTIINTLAMFVAMPSLWLTKLANNEFG